MNEKERLRDVAALFRLCGRDKIHPALSRTTNQIELHNKTAALNRSYLCLQQT